MYLLPYFDPASMVNMDGMHTIGGVVKEVVVKGMQGLRIGNASMRLKQAVQEYNGSKGDNPGRAGKQGGVW